MWRLSTNGAAAVINSWLKESFIEKNPCLKWQINLHSAEECNKFATQPISRKSEQICNRSVKTCCQQADIFWMRSLALYLSVLTGPQRLVNRSVTSCCDRAAAMLFSTGLSQVVVTKLQQCCFQQACRKLLTQSCSKQRKALYEASACFQSSQRITASLVALIICQDENETVDCNNVRTVKSEIKRENRQR